MALLQNDEYARLVSELNEINKKIIRGMAIKDVDFGENIEVRIAEKHGEEEAKRLLELCQRRDEIRKMIDKICDAA